MNRFYPFLLFKKSTLLINFISICQIDVSSEGRILLSINPSDPGKSGIKFLLLNPAASHFGDLVAECRSVVVAGGTMQPVEEFKEQLFVAAGGHQGECRAGSGGIS